MQVIILSGVPGSGKSTWAKKNFPDASICSADDYFVDCNGYKFDASHLTEAHNWCMRKFIEEVRTGQIQAFCDVIIVDNTNTSSEEIAPYYHVAAAYDCEITLITFDINTSSAAKRNVHGVGEHTIVSMARAIANRVLPRYWQHNPNFSTSTISNDCER